MRDMSVLEHRPLRLELGCANRKRRADAVGIDLLDLPDVDVVGDALEVLRMIPDSCVESIYSEHFLEHVTDPEALVREAARVLVPGGEFRAIIPHFSNPGFYSDPTHRSYFGLYTFGYWTRRTPFRRKVPTYAEPAPLVVYGATFHFKASRPFYVRHGIVKVLSAWVNISNWTKEFYEAHMCWMMPAYEVEFVLRRD
ncbi:MAG: methyltransferase domain-containing protein [Microlunatus sp.]|uniref:methyltransferase domain-containing protein n=1 Tax=Intrasporangium sp. TaxID=1925024 RepID=UPI002648E9E9|nr:methyltransferase domain-containing protein [Intrasporangium sp.]MDN5763969.1 methyltransferase domain-containing protein [Microlunatus sp.]MDN5794741.1 methyltransferase domain-containing protein [Intrasporangium sp.]